MGTITGTVIIQQASEILEDTGNVVYTAAQMLASVNNAQRAVTMVRPDAKAQTSNLLLATGDNEQALPAGARRLMGVVRNQGADGVTVGQAVRGPVTMEEMDGTDPAWHTRTGPYVKSYVYNEDTPDVFYVYPRVASTWYLRIKTAMHPTDLASASDTIDLEDVYVPAIIEWVLYEKFARDSERTPNWTRAGRHLQNFYQLLGVKLRSDLFISPQLTEHGKQLAAAGAQ